MYFLCFLHARERGRGFEAKSRSCHKNNSQQMAGLLAMYTVKMFGLLQPVFGYLSCIEQWMVCNSDAQIGSK